MTLRSSLSAISAILLGLSLGCMEPQHSDFLEHASPDLHPATSPGNPAFNPD